MNSLKQLLVATAALAAIGTAQADGPSYVLDPTHTFVTFEASHFGTSTVRGRFDKKEGRVMFDRAAKSGRIEVTLDTGSINTGVAPFDKHLQSKDFFDSATHPTAKFVGDKLGFSGNKVDTVSGTLTLLGKTAPVTLKASNFNCYTNPIFKREVCGGDFETTIKRSQWGMNYGIAMGIPDDVRLLIQVEAIKE
jgi:polyisoprenoid-binding protein YceI